ncbi:MAG TPA: hypothetical protein VFG69_15235, partial [Nannocystaceae bacterium]|nr:hypothetical protein [Nannocystaceae bacterium]
MGATWASSTPLTAVGLAFAWSLMEVLHEAGGDETRLTCAQVGVRVRLTAEESEAALAELQTWTSVAVTKRGIRWREWRSRHLSDPKRAARNRRYREGRKARGEPPSSETSRETSSETTHASPEEIRRDEKRSEDKARARPPAPPRALSRIEPS